MKVLVVGAGGREHALAWKINQSPLVDQVICAPGNGGMAQIGPCFDVADSDIDGQIALVKAEGVDFVVIGPEAPLVAGLADALDAEDIPHFGCSQEAAVLEGSKGFVKDLCADYDIPTSAYARFSDAAAARAYVEEQGAPIVIKADGLAAGKGVTVAETLDQALAAIDDCFDGKFGDSGAEVVVEECLFGEEASFFVFSDGESVLALEAAQDHKRAFDGDEGPNTGGMGSYSPTPVMTPKMCHRAMEEMIKPTIQAMKDKGIPYKGVLYLGLMITDKGPQLIEYNVRFGDPECQILMMRMKSDIMPILMAVADGTLKDQTIEWHDGVALTVIMAANGYPEGYKKGTLIEGVGDAEKTGAVVFHAGTKQNGDRLEAHGGRVLCVSAMGKNVTEAAKAAYTAVDEISWPDGFCRRDIGWRAIQREQT